MKQELRLIMSMEPTKKKLPPWQDQEVYAITFKIMKARDLNAKLKQLLKEINNNAKTLS